MKKIDPLTGNSYESEKRMYIRYHGLSDSQAETVMYQNTYQDRDLACLEAINYNSLRRK